VLPTAAAGGRPRQWAVYYARDGEQLLISTLSQRLKAEARGGASLIDPLGSARSHGCIRLSNNAIDWLVRPIGAAQLAGPPVSVH
jgi:hypothetical protein